MLYIDIFRIRLTCYSTSKSELPFNVRHVINSCNLLNLLNELKATIPNASLGSKRRKHLQKTLLVEDKTCIVQVAL